MGILILSSDFTGKKYAVPVDSLTVDGLDFYITKYEKKYLIELLGAELYLLFVTDLTAKVPQTAKYLSIFNAFNEDEGCTIVSSEGMKEMLKGFIYFEYLRDMPFKATTTGVVINQNENSVQSNNDTLYQRYNEAIKTFKAIQWYIGEHSEDYPDYNGQLKGLAHWSL